METKTGSKEQQFDDSISQSSSSRSSSITSESSDGHFDIRHFPLPKPSLTASEARKQRESHQAYNSSVSSYTGSSWSHQSHLADSPGYDPNRIPSSVFSSKPANSTEWSIASNESLFSIHDRTFSISTREDHGLAGGLRLSEIPRFEEPVHEIIEIKPVPLPLPLPPVKKPTESEKDTVTEKKPNEVEESDSEIDHDNQKEEQEMTELESDGEHEGDEDMFEPEIVVETLTGKQEEKEAVEDLKENKPEDENSNVSHSPSISCRSDTSNNSIASFAFPVLQKEDGIDKTPSMETRENVSHKRRPQSPMQPAQPTPLPYSESGTPTQSQPQSQPQLTDSKKIEFQTQSRKTSTNSWFSCFHCPSKCGLFK